MLFYDATYILVLIGALLSMWASARVNLTYKKYAQVHSRSGLTGAEAARRILQARGSTMYGWSISVETLQITMIPGERSCGCRIPSTGLLLWRRSVWRHTNAGMPSRTTRRMRLCAFGQPLCRWQISGQKRRSPSSFWDWFWGAPTHWCRWGFCALPAGRFSSSSPFRWSSMLLPERWTFWVTLICCRRMS